MSKPTTALSDMDYDEVSFVALAANQEADIVLFKSDKRVARGSCDHDSMDSGDECPTCGKVKKSLVTMPDHSALIAKSKALINIAKYNKNHSTTNGQFTSGGGGGAPHKGGAPSDKNMSGGA